MRRAKTSTGVFQSGHAQLRKKLIAKLSSKEIVIQLGSDWVGQRGAS